VEVWKKFSEDPTTKKKEEEEMLRLSKVQLLDVRVKKKT